VKFTRLIFSILGQCNKWFQGLAKFFNFKEYREIQCRFDMAKEHSARRRLTTIKLDLNLRMNLVKCYIWNIAFYDAATWTLWEVDQIYLESIVMWHWRGMEKIS
jgi:hypothetical protein